MKYTYQIKPRSVELGAGWELTLLEDGQEVGGGVFPIGTDDPQADSQWWDELTEKKRAHWLSMASSNASEAARYAYLLAEAYNDAQDEADAWLDARAQ